MPHFHRTIIEFSYILFGTVRLHDGTGWLAQGCWWFLWTREPPARSAPAWKP